MDDPLTSGVTEGFGLMFYNARWYDPYITQFSQPDTIIPDPSNSSDWNRYAYARYNPIRYNDPSGHKACWATNNYTCYLTEQQMRDRLSNEYYVDIVEIDAAFTYAQIKDIYDGVVALANAMGGSDNFKENIGGINIVGLNAEHMVPKGLTSRHLMYLNQDNMDLWTVVHELAHAWDANNNWSLSKGLEQKTGGHTNWFESRFEGCSANDDTSPGCNSAGYYYGGTPPKGSDGNFNRLSR